MHFTKKQNNVCKFTYSANHAFTVKVDNTFFKKSLFDFIF